MRIRVYKRGPRYWLDYRFAGDRLRYPVSDTRKAADLAVQQIQADVASGRFKGPSRGYAVMQDIGTFAALTQEWFSLRSPGIRPETRRFYETVLRGLRQEFGEKYSPPKARGDPGKWTGTSKPLHAIRPRDCQRIVSQKLAASSSPVRANRYLTVLRSLFKSAIEWELLSRDPTVGLRKRKEPRREVILSAEHVHAIVGACESWLRPIVLTAYHTGPRRGDLLGREGEGGELTWDDVDLERRVISFRVTKEKEPRRVPISKELLAVLAELPSRFKGGAVFVDGEGEAVKPERASRRFRAAAVRAGVPEAPRIRFHDLRHSCATTLIERGADVYDVKTLLGHHGVQMTERYVHARRGRLQDLVERLGTPKGPGA